MEVDPPHLRGRDDGQNPRAGRLTQQFSTSDPADGGWFDDDEGGQALEDFILWSSQRVSQVAGAPRRVTTDLCSCLGSVQNARAQFKETSI